MMVPRMSVDLHDIADSILAVLLLFLAFIGIHWTSPARGSHPECSGCAAGRARS